MRVHDRLLLVLSKNSIDSAWVEKEVETAMERERREKRDVLFPISLDGAFMKTDIAWAADVRRTRHTTDFSKWKSHDDYAKVFERLLRDLRRQSERKPGS
ncbi:MAG: toll/interleukin-1 receptor domain-containing protein [Tagaea sp.]